MTYAKNAILVKNSNVALCNNTLYRGWWNLGSQIS